MGNGLDMSIEMMASGYEINGTGGGMDLMKKPEKDHGGRVHGLYVHGRI